MQTVKFPADFQYLDEIRDFVGAIAAESGFDDKEVYAIQLATDEGASNIIEHAYAGIPNGEVEIVCGMEGGVLKIVLRDRGKSFDPDSIHQPDLKAALTDRQIGGLGIYLMRKLMDEVHYGSAPGGGNQLTLTKRRG